MQRNPKTKWKQHESERQRSLKRIGISCQSIKRTRTFLLSWCGKHCFLGFPAYIGGAEGCFLPACMYYIEKPENAFTMLDGKKQKHRDHREASVARSVLISATERLSEPQGGEFSRMADNKRSNRTENAGGQKIFFLKVLAFWFMLLSFCFRIPLHSLKHP